MDSQKLEIPILSALHTSDDVDIPKGWSFRRINEFAKEINVRYSSNIEAPVLSVTKHRGFVNSLAYFKKQIYSKDLTNYKLVKKNDFAYATIHLDEGSIGLLQDYEYAYISPMYTVFRIDSSVNPEYLFILMKSEFLLQKYSTMGRGSVNRRKAIPFEDISELTLLLPSLDEQNKISSIISDMNLLISQTDKVIDQYQILKLGLLQQLFTRGIGHTNFKKVNIGKPLLDIEIPNSWSLKPFRNILIVQNNSIDLDDVKKYVRITVKRNHEGVILRDVVEGKQILTKTQFKVNSGDFIISRRQIIHNACGIVPKKFDGAVVSNEYSIFHGSNCLDIDYLDWFSQTNLFKKTIIATTHGVDIEKYVFVLDEWLDLKMPLPDEIEQKNIVKILSSVENKLFHEKKYKEILINLKRGLIQKLLIGQIRVKI